MQAILAVYEDGATLKRALAFEAALAGAKAEVGLISRECARRISKLCETIVISPAEVAEEAVLAGTLALPLVGFAQPLLAILKQARRCIGAPQAKISPTP